MLDRPYMQVKNLWSYNPIPGGCVLYLPLWHPNLGGLKYKSIDPFEHTCTRTASGVLHFDGSSNSSVDFGAIHDATDKLWISFWFKLDTAFSSASPTTQELFAKYVNGTNYFYCYLDETDGKLYLDHGEGAGPETISSTETTWAADTWHHIIASMSTAAGQRMIVNGGSAVAEAGNQTAINLVASIVFGAAVVDSAGYFVGEIKEVVMGTDDLNAGEEAALYAGTLPGDETEYWPMDEGSGTGAGAIKDQEGTADADGAIDSACTWENVPQHQRANGHYFDGFDDWINCGNNSVLNFTSGAFTIIVIAETNDKTANMRFFNRGAINVDGYELWLDNDVVKFRTAQGTPASQTTEADNVITTNNTWYHIAVTRSGATGTIYSAGVDVTSTPGVHVNPTTSAKNAYIGVYTNEIEGFWIGTIGEVYIYDRALSAAELLYHKSKTLWRYQ